VLPRISHFAFFDLQRRYLQKNCFYVTFYTRSFIPTSFGQRKEKKLAMMVRYPDPLKSARARLVWNETTKRWRIFYGLNGDEANTELPESIEGIYFTNPLTESTAVYLFS
jgi:hypothetical protein